MSYAQSYRQLDIEDLVDRYGHSDCRTRSRRHGYQPNADLHVRRFLDRVVNETRVVDMALESGLKVRAIYSSITRGKALVTTGLARDGIVS